MTTKAGVGDRWRQHLSGARDVRFADHGSLVHPSLQGNLCLHAFGRSVLDASPRISRRLDVVLLCFLHVCESTGG